MVKFWYLATVIPIPKWFIKPIEKLLFEFLWSGRPPPPPPPTTTTIKREMFYLPIENGGLDLLEPNTQQKTLRLRSLQNIINPLCKTK